VGQHEWGWEVSIYDSDIENLPVNIRLAMTDEMTTLDVLLPDDLNYTLRMTKESAIAAYKSEYIKQIIPANLKSARLNLKQITARIIFKTICLK
jgi:hypothetical protein